MIHGTAAARTKRSKKRSRTPLRFARKRKPRSGPLAKPRARILRRRNRRQSPDAAPRSRPRLAARPTLQAPAAEAPAAAGPAASPAPSPWASGGAGALAPTGVNLIGLIRSEIGVGESSRLAAAALDAAGVPFGMIDLPGISLSRSGDATWLHKEMSAAPFPVNIFHLNADVMPMARAHFGSELFEDRFNIGYWHWELPIFPDEQLGGFAQLQEIWVPSQYVFESLLPKSPVCVVKIPHGISMPPPVDLPREYFGLPRSPFLFLSMYDSYSFQQRKNPKAAIEAFLRAFPEPKPDQVGLVIKINNAHEQDLEQVRAFTGGRPDCHIITPVLSRMQMNALLHSVQCFVSLHRSEGFGLGLAEAMYLGKPVIGTYWSGNTEFMNPANSCTVDFSLVHVGTDLGPYQAYQLWAEPNLDHAAYYMKRLLTDTVWRNTMADNGRQTIHTYFSAPLAGQRIRERLAQLGF